MLSEGVEDCTVDEPTAQSAPKPANEERPPPNAYQRWRAPGASRQPAIQSATARPATSLPRTLNCVSRHMTRADSLDAAIPRHEHPQRSEPGEDRR